MRAQRNATIGGSFTVVGFACYLVSDDHKRGIKCGRTYHAKSAAEECVKLYQKNAAEGDSYVLREVMGAG